LNIDGQADQSLAKLRRLGVDALPAAIQPRHTATRSVTQQDRKFHLRGRQRMEGHAAPLASTLGEATTMLPLRMRRGSRATYVADCSASTAVIKGERRNKYSDRLPRNGLRSEGLRSSWPKQPNNPFAHGHEIGRTRLSAQYLAYLRGTTSTSSSSRIRMSGGVHGQGEEGWCLGRDRHRAWQECRHPPDRCDDVSTLP